MASMSACSRFSSPAPNCLSSRLTALIGRARSRRNASDALRRRCKTEGAALKPPFSLKLIYLVRLEFVEGRLLLKRGTRLPQAQPERQIVISRQAAQRIPISLCVCTDRRHVG